MTVHVLALDGRTCVYVYIHIYIFITVHQYANTCHCRFIKVSCFKQECFSLGVFFLVCVCVLSLNFILLINI